MYVNEKQYLENYLKLKKNELKKEKIEWKKAILTKEINKTIQKMEVSNNGK